MKSEKAVLDNLERVVNTMQSMIDGLSEEELKTPSTEQADKFLVLFSFLMGLAWVLDCEDELQEVLLKIKIKGLSEKLGSLLSKERV